MNGFWLKNLMFKLNVLLCICCLFLKKMKLGSAQFKKKKWNKIIKVTEQEFNNVQQIRLEYLLRWEFKH